MALGQEEKLSGVRSSQCSVLCSIVIVLETEEGINHCSVLHMFSGVDLFTIYGYVMDMAMLVPFPLIL
jgi:hypothetical protein